jgi:hypothetical protein
LDLAGLGGGGGVGFFLQEAHKMAKARSTEQHINIPAPKFQVAEFVIVGDSPYVQNKFSSKALQQMKDKQSAGSQGNKGKKRDPKDFQACYEGAMHKAKEGWHGIPAPAFRCGCISACRIVGFKMTLAKLSIFIEADGFDVEDGTPLVRIVKGQPVYHEASVRNESGVCDVRARPMWREGWEARLRIRFDNDQFSVEDVSNLLARVGSQVGVGEGRPDSKKSCGLGWGLFHVKAGK